MPVQMADMKERQDAAEGLVDHNIQKLNARLMRSSKTPSRSAVSLRPSPLVLCHAEVTINACLCDPPVVASLVLSRFLNSSTWQSCTW